MEIETALTLIALVGAFLLLATISFESVKEITDFVMQKCDFTE